MPFESAFKGIHVIARDDGIPLSMHSTAQLHPQSPYWGFDPGTTLSPNPSILDPSDGGCLADLDQRSCSTPGPNSTGMGVVRGYTILVFNQSHPGLLSLAIPPWVGATSTGDGLGHR